MLHIQGTCSLPCQLSLRAPLVVHHMGAVAVINFIQICNALTTRLCFRLSDLGSRLLSARYIGYPEGRHHSRRMSSAGTEINHTRRSAVDLTLTSELKHR